jgi:hypothetical protein
MGITANEKLAYKDQVPWCKPCDQAPHDHRHCGTRWAKGTGCEIHKTLRRIPNVRFYYQDDERREERLIILAHLLTDARKIVSPIAEEVKINYPPARFFGKLLDESAGGSDSDSGDTPEGYEAQALIRKGSGKGDAQAARTGPSVRRAFDKVGRGTQTPGREGRGTQGAGRAEHLMGVNVGRRSRREVTQKGAGTKRRTAQEAAAGELNARGLIGGEGSSPVSKGHVEAAEGPGKGRGRGMGGAAAAPQGMGSGMGLRGVKTSAHVRGREAGQVSSHKRPRGGAVGGAERGAEAGPVIPVGVKKSSKLRREAASRDSSLWQAEAWVNGRPSTKGMTFSRIHLSVLLSTEPICPVRKCAC